FDSGRRRLILEPGRLYDVPYDYDLTGFTIVSNGAAFGVGSVEHGTIAGNATLREGDVIVALDGKPVAGMSLSALRKEFTQDGRSRLLTIQRLGVEQSVRLTMMTLR
ncbi:MAG: PDZ domain-containing protein, partial [Vicinamibacterales bacterium]